MPETKRPVNLDEDEASLALHALRFYKNAKGGEVSTNTEQLEAKLDKYLSGTTFVVTKVENVASLLGARGGTKGGVSTSDAKRAAAAANGAKGGRPHKPNLFIKFSKSVWQEPDPKLLNELYKLVGNNTWLPDERGDETEGPYVRVYIQDMGKRLGELFGHFFERLGMGRQGPVSSMHGACKQFLYGTARRRKVEVYLYNLWQARALDLLNGCTARNF